MGRLEQMSRDLVLARSGDQEAKIRLLRRGIPMAAKRIVPQFGWAVDMAAGVFDAIARDELQAPDYEAGYASPGFKRFVRWLTHLESGVVVIIGGRGTGKTVTQCAIAERWQAPHKYIVGVDPAALQTTPLEPFDWNAGRIRGLPLGSVLLVPDSGLYLDARDFGSSSEQAVRELVEIARHRRLRIVLDVQYSRLLANSAFLCDALLYKSLGPAWQVIERDELRSLARLSQEAFELIPPSERKRYVYALSQEADFKGTLPVTLPTWYSDAISKSHANPYVIEGEFREVDEDEPAAKRRRR